MERRSFLLTAVAAATSLGAPSLRAQGTSTISLVMPLGPGSGADTTARLLADYMGRDLKRSVIVENKPGADTMIAAQYVLNYPADGTRVLFISPTTAVLLPLVNKKLGFDPATQLEPIMLTLRNGTALIVKAGRYKSLAELVADAKARPGKISIATYAGHYYKLISLLMQRDLGIELNDVQYKSPTPAINDVIGGTVDAMLIDAGAAREFYLAGRINMLALTHARRPEMFNEVPTFEELGYPRVTSYIWTGFAVKTGTPPEIIQRLSQSLSAALQSKLHLDHLAKQKSGSEIMAYDPERAKQYIQQESKRFADLIANTGYTAE